MSGGTYLYQTTVLVDCWTKISDLSRVNAEEDCWKMQEEVKSIIRAQERNFDDSITGINMMYPGPMRLLADPDASIVHRQLEVEVYYQE